MPLVLEGVDLGVLMCVLVLIGTLMAVRYTFARLAAVLDVSILHVRPFHGVAAAIENTIIAGCNAGIEALQHVARDLWAASVWAWREMVKGLSSFATDVEAWAGWLVHHGVPAIVHAIVDPYIKIAHEAKALATAAYSYVDRKIVGVEADIRRSAAATLTTAERNAAGLVHGLEDRVGDDLIALRRELSRGIDAGIRQAETEAQRALGELRAAEEAAVGAAAAAERATAKELRDLLGGLDPATVAGLIAAVPLLAAALHALEAEAGLDKAECRSKVKGICSVPAHRWGKLLGLLALGAEWPGLETFAEEAARFTGEVVGAIEDLAGVG